MSARPGISLIAAFAALVVTTSEGLAQQLDLTDGLDFGPVAQGGSLAVSATDPRAARVDADLRDGGPPACTSVPAEIEFTGLPLALLGPDGASVALSFAPSSARIWQLSDPGTAVEFDPSSVIAEFPTSAFPAVIGLGGAVSVPENAPIGEYVGEAQLTLTYYGPQLGHGGCSGTARSQSLSIPISVEVQGELMVSAGIDRVDLGLLLHGMVVDVPVDGSGEAGPAPFVVTGPASLDYRLVVSTRNLEHEVEADELPLIFLGGLYGTTLSPDTAFGNGDVVPASLHAGGPLHVHCGFRVEVPEGVAEGRYRGEITLTVEVLLH